MFYRPWVIILGLSAAIFVVNYVVLPELAPEPPPGRPLPVRASSVADTPVSDAAAAREVVAAVTRCLRAAAALDPLALDDESLEALYDDGGHEALLRASCVPLLSPPLSTVFSQVYGRRAVWLIRLALARAFEAARRAIDAGAVPEVAWSDALLTAVSTIDEFHTDLAALYKAYVDVIGPVADPLPSPASP